MRQEGKDANGAVRQFDLTMASQHTKLHMIRGRHCWQTESGGDTRAIASWARPLLLLPLLLLLLVRLVLVLTLLLQLSGRRPAGQL